MRRKQIIEYSEDYYKYIEDNIVPYEDKDLQVKYLKGDMGYDEQYVKEHLTNNNINLIQLL